MEMFQSHKEIENKIVVSKKGIQNLNTRLLAIWMYFKLFRGDVKPLIMCIRSQNVEDGFLRSTKDMCCSNGCLKHRNMDLGYHNIVGDNRIDCSGVFQMDSISGRLFSLTTKCKLVDIACQSGYVFWCETILMEIVKVDEKFVSVRDFGDVTVNMASNKVEDDTYVRKCFGRHGIEQRRNRSHMYALLASKQILENMAADNFSIDRC